MKNVIELKDEIEETRDSLNMIILDMDSDIFNYSLLIDVSLKLDKLILEYIKMLNR